MPLHEVFDRIRPSVIGFAPKYAPKPSPETRQPPIAPVFGTGFVVHQSGLIATNAHVLRAFRKVFRPPGLPNTDWGVFGMLFHQTSEGVIEIQLDVIGAVEVAEFGAGDHYYGPLRPDIALVHVKARGLPAVQLAEERQIVPGMELATAGFPLGSRALMAPGWLHQLCPTLQKGVVSAVLPFSCATYHAFTLNVMALGGASGSPVFDPDSGLVQGVLYGGLTDSQAAGPFTYSQATTISYVVPSHYAAIMLREVCTGSDLPLPHPDALTIEEMLAGREVVSIFDTEDADQHHETPASTRKRVVKSTLAE